MTQKNTFFKFLYRNAKIFLQLLIARKKKSKKFFATINSPKKIFRTIQPWLGKAQHLWYKVA
jgi:hypothetical protein